MMRNSSWAVCLAMFAGVSLAAEGTSEIVGRKTDGRQFTAHLVEKTDDHQLVFEQSGQRQSISMDQLVMWGGYSV